MISKLLKNGLLTNDLKILVKMTRLLITDRRAGLDIVLAKMAWLGSK